MEQEKIGRFILELRKKQNLTQKELAEKLGVTDRAVSKWENGRGMPDVSLMKPLCDILGITVSELLGGERIDKQDYREKSEFRFLNTIEVKEKTIQKKNITLRLVAVAVVLLLFAGIALIYWLPLTRGHFSAEEDVEIFYVHKTLPIAPYGEPLERFSLTDFFEQDITERVDLEKLEMLLPLMRVTVYGDDYNTMRYWQGDYIYEIFGYFKSGPKRGETFHIMIGDYGRNYLQPHSGRIHTIAEQEAWLEIMEDLEGWGGEYRENFLWEEEHIFSLIYEGKLYSGAGRLLDLPEGPDLSHIVSGISAAPDEELECNFGTQGQRAVTWTEDGQTYLAVQVSYDKAFGIPIDAN